MLALFTVGYCMNMYHDDMIPGMRARGSVVVGGGGGLVLVLVVFVVAVVFRNKRFFPHDFVQPARPRPHSLIISPRDTRHQVSYSNKSSPHRLQEGGLDSMCLRYIHREEIMSKRNNAKCTGYKKEEPNNNNPQKMARKRIFGRKTKIS